MGLNEEQLLADVVNDNRSDDEAIAEFESLTDDVQPPKPDATELAVKAQDQVDPAVGGFEGLARDIFPEEAAAIDQSMADVAGVSAEVTPSKGEVKKSNINQQAFQKALPSLLKPLFNEDILIDPSLGLKPGATMSLGKLNTQAVASIADAVQEVGNGALALGDVVDDWLKKKGVTAEEYIKPNTRLDFVENTFPAPNATSEKITRAVAKHVVGIGLLAKASKGATVAKTATKGASLGAAYSFFVQDPKEENLSNLVSEGGPDFLKPIAKALAIDKDSGEVVNRFRNAAESLLLDGAMATGLGLMTAGYKGARTIKASIQETAKEAEKVKFIEKATKEFEKAAAKEVASDAPSVVINAERLFESTKKGTTPSGFTVNVERLAESDDTRAFIQEAVKNNKASFDSFRRGVLADDELVARAALLQEDPRAIEKLINLKPGSALNAEEKLAVDGMFSAVAEEFQSFIKKYDPDKATAVQKQMFINYQTSFDKLAKVSLATSAEAGRTLRATQIVPKLTSIQKAKYLAEQVSLLGQDEKKLVAVFKEFADKPAEDFLQDMSKTYQKSIGRKVFDAALEVRQNGLLSSGKTFVTGSLSPMLITGPAAIVERGLGRLYTIATGDAKGVAKGETGALAAAYFSESARTVSTMVTGFTDWVTQAAHAISEGDVSEFLKNTGKAGKEQLEANGKKVSSRLAFGNLLEPDDRKAKITAKNFGLDQEGFLGNLVDYTGAVIRTPTAAMSKSDQMVGQILYNMEKNALAIRELANRGIDITSDEGNKIYRAIVSDMPENVEVPWINDAVKNIRAGAFEFQAKSKFQSDLDGLFKKFDEGIIKKDFLGAPWLRMFIPFARTEMNILSYGLERFPALGSLSSKVRSDIEAGGAKRAMALGKQAMGGMFMAVGGMLAANGVLTGTGPRNKEAKDLLKAKGWQENSIKVGDTYYRIDRLADPFASMMTFAADLAAIAPEIPASKAQDFSALANASAAAFMELMSPQFLTRNFADLIDFINPNNQQNFSENMQKITTNLAKGQVPFSAALRDVSRNGLPFGLAQGDNVVRERWNNGEHPFWSGLQQMYTEIIADIPGFSEKLPPRLNAFGDKIVYPAGFGPDEISPIAMMDEATGSRKTVVDELVRLGVAGKGFVTEPPPGQTHLTIRLPNKTVTKMVGGVPATVDLSPQQYSNLVKYSSGIDLDPALNPTGQDMTFEQAILEEIENGWPSLGGFDDDQSRRVFISSLHNAFKAAAEQQLSTDDLDFADQLNDTIARTIDLRDGVLDEE